MCTFIGGTPRISPNARVISAVSSRSPAWLSFPKMLAVTYAIGSLFFPRRYRRHLS